MKKLTAVWLFLLSVQFLPAQHYNPSKVDRKALQLYNGGITHAQDGNYKEAISLFEQAIYIDSGFVDALLSIAGVYGQMKNHKLAVEYYSKAIRKDSVYTRLYKLPYSINLAGMGEFEKAMQVIDEYLSNPAMGENSRRAGEYRKKCWTFALDYKKNHPDNNYAFNPENLGDHVNSVESEYFPSLTIDGRELVFTRRLNNFNEDFFSSKKEENNWTKATPLGGNVNTSQNEGAQMISQDGEWLVFTGCNRRDGWGSCDLYISFLTPEGWSEALNMGGKINSDQWDSQPSLSPDKKDLYFASRRLGGYGGSDIYVSHLLPDGQWTNPENLGPEINTAGDESSPFIHADNQSLYFTSNGLPGYGEDDLFVTRRGPKAVWSKPENLGYPINTIHKEGTLFIAADGKTAYYASDRTDSYGGLDIYSFELKEDIRPNRTLWVQGTVFDKKTRKGLPSELEMINIETGETLNRVQTDERGNYLITLPVGTEYAFNVNRKGYLFYSDNFFIEKNAMDSVFKKDIPLQPIELNASIVLKNIFFDVNRFELKPESEAELDKLVQLLNDNPELKIEISGHTDNTGNEQDNLVLSENRARSVVNYLLAHHIDPSRLSSTGYGETKPVAGNDSEEGRAQNRRTEMRVTGQ